MTFDDYAKIDAVNWSTLKELRRSPKHYRYRLENPREDRPAFARGRAAHTAVFEPRRFLRDYALFEDGIRRGKKWEAFKEQHAHQTILKPDEYDTCLAIADAVKATPIAASYLERGEPEKSIQWTDADTGLACKGRLDWWNADRGVLLDLKTASDVSDYRFGSIAARLGYHCQLAFYAEGLRANTGRTPAVVIVAVEADAPHDVAVYRIDEDALYAGWEEVRGLLDKVAICRASNRWPGRYEEEQVLRLPSWVWPDEEADTALDGEISFNSAPAALATAQEE
jgi:hypothetical protein